jgi:hypothetical protein
VVNWKLGKWYHDLSLGLVTKAKACKDAGQDWSPRVTFHAPESVECEGKNPHTPKQAPTLGITDFWIFKEQIQGSEFIGLKK